MFKLKKSHRVTFLLDFWLGTEKSNRIYSSKCYNKLLILVIFCEFVILYIIYKRWI